MNMRNTTINSALQDLKKGTFSCVELAETYLENIKKHNKSLNAFITVTDQEALRQAQESDKRYKSGDNRVLEGVPIALKDLFLTKGVRTTAASKVLDDYIPQYDGTVVKKLKEAGAVIVGKTNCDAWAHGSSGENSDYGPTKNPYDLDRVPGGSSSGSPVAVSTNMALGATGTDTGGSIRLPAAFCNVVGLKPTYGRVSRYGVIAMASSFDSIGHFTKTVEDNALLLSVTHGDDPHDATSVSNRPFEYAEKLNKGVRGLKIGVPAEYFTKGLNPKIKQTIDDALSFYESEGAKIIEVSLPHTDYAIATYYILQTAEVSSNLGRYDGIRYANTREFFGDEAKRRIMLGTYVLSSGYYDAYYNKGRQVRTLICGDYANTFEKVDVILAPTSPTKPWKFGEKVDDPISMYLSDIYTVTGNIAGVPGLNIQAGFVEGLPVGFQILGPQFSESLLYQVAKPWEDKTEFWKQEAKILKNAY